MLTKDDKYDLLLAICTGVALMSVMYFMTLRDTDPVTDEKEGIIFTRALTDSKEYKECAKDNLKTIKQFRDCLRDKGVL